MMRPENYKGLDIKGSSMEIGYIKLHRSLLEWEWIDDHNCLRLFIFLLLTVNYEPKKWHGITIEPGQLVTSLENLAFQTKLSVKQVRTALDKLKSTGEVANQSTNNYRVITVTNWKDYQGEGRQEGRPAAGGGQAEGRQRATTKEGKKERKKEIYNPLPLKPEEGVLENIEKKVFKILDVISPEAIQRARQQAPCWDIKFLAKVYDDGVEQRGIPEKPDDAFPKWCKLYTKGNPP